jgi:hypothetical protein
MMAVPALVPAVNLAVALSTVPTPGVEVGANVHVPPGVVVTRALVVTPSAHRGVMGVLLSGELGAEMVVFIAFAALSQPEATDFTFTFLTVVPLTRFSMTILPVPSGVRLL